ncbi:MAG TPA: cupin domain-containing protein [Candidatus Binataceae bacterium]|nr:cupin domain-containing protein [Candidatus Binataceae bacterium]
MAAGSIQPAQTLDDLYAQMRAQEQNRSPSFFHLRAQLPLQGRTHLPLATTDRMRVWLKTYASGGENELHAHPLEDHVFVVLQGAAEFHDREGTAWQVEKLDGVFLPRGAFYWFKTVSDEPLVMLRVGAIAPGADLMKDGRIDVNGQPMSGYSVENKEVPLILSDRWFE